MNKIVNRSKHSHRQRGVRTKHPWRRRRNRHFRRIFPSGAKALPRLEESGERRDLVRRSRRPKHAQRATRELAPAITTVRTGPDDDSVRKSEFEFDRFESVERKRTVFAGRNSGSGGLVHSRLDQIGVERDRRVLQGRRRSGRSDFGRG